MMGKRQLKKGFTLAETMVTVFVVSVGVLGAYYAIQRTTQVVVRAHNQLIASYLSQEGIEIIKNIRDTNFLEMHANPSDTSNHWDDGLADGAYEADYTVTNQVDPLLMPYAGRSLKYDATLGYNYSSGEDTKFTRKLEIVSCGSDCKTIIVTVFWKEGGKTFNVQTIEEIYNWL